MYSTGAAAAYTSDSFVVDTDPYLFESIQASRFSLRSPASTYSVSALAASDPVSSIPLNSTLPVMTVSPNVWFFGVWNGNSLLPGESIFDSVSPSFDNFKILSSGSIVSNASVSVPVDDQIDFEYFRYPMTSFKLSYDVSSLNSSCIQLNGIFTLRAEVYWGKWYLSKGFDLDVYVDGDLQKSYSTSDRNLDFGGWVYDSSSTVQEIVFEVTVYPVEVSLSSSSPSSGTVNVCIYGSSTASIDGLSDDDVLAGFNDNAQDAINQQDALESQWTGSMTENFNNLSLADFAFPVGAVNAFSLISGIFTDLWNAMGDFRIAYVFPLMLGIVLLLVGRLSRTSVKRSSGRGEDDV